MRNNVWKEKFLYAWPVSASDGWTGESGSSWLTSQGLELPEYGSIQTEMDLSTCWALIWFWMASVDQKASVGDVSFTRRRELFLKGFPASPSPLRSSLLCSVRWVGSAALKEDRQKKPYRTRLEVNRNRRNPLCIQGSTWFYGSQHWSGVLGMDERAKQDLQDSFME